MTENLLPCPFCGGEATVGTIPIVGGGYLYAFVEYMNTNIELPLRGCFGG